VLQPMIAGDLDHLYFEYQDCSTDTCARMLASSVDGGHTWRRLPLRWVDDAGEEPVLVQATGATVLAARRTVRTEPFDAKATVWGAPYPGADFRTSTDAGVTWRRVTPRAVRALPDGWSVFEASDTLLAYDPATGDVVFLRAQGRPPGLLWMEHGLPPEAGIWLHGMADELFLAVSRDGGATWRRTDLPVPLRRNGKISWGPPLDQLTTADGQTVYALDKAVGRAQLHVSVDGGRTWQARARLPGELPVETVLATREGPLLVEQADGVYRSTDQGRTVTRVGPNLGESDLIGGAVPGGYAEPLTLSDYGVWLSPDGGTWTYVPPPSAP
jgi:hypothetical protein